MMVNRRMTLLSLLLSWFAPKPEETPPEPIEGVEIPPGLTAGSDNTCYGYEALGKNTFTGIPTVQTGSNNVILGRWDDDA